MVKEREPRPVVRGIDGVGIVSQLKLIKGVKQAPHSESICSIVLCGVLGVRVSTSSGA